MGFCPETVKPKENVCTPFETRRFKRAFHVDKFSFLSLVCAQNASNAFKCFKCLLLLLSADVARKVLQLINLTA